MRGLLTDRTEMRPRHFTKHDRKVAVNPYHPLHELEVASNCRGQIGLRQPGDKLVWSMNFRGTPWRIA